MKKKESHFDKFKPKKRTNERVDEKAERKYEINSHGGATEKIKRNKT